MLLIGVRLSPPPSPHVLLLLASPKAQLQSLSRDLSTPGSSPLILWEVLQSSFLALEAAASTPPAMGGCPRPSALHPRVRGLGAHPQPCAEPAPGDGRWQCHPGVPWGDQAPGPGRAEVWDGSVGSGDDSSPHPRSPPLLHPKWGAPSHGAGVVLVCGAAWKAMPRGCRTNSCQDGAAQGWHRFAGPPSRPAWASVSLKQQRDDIQPSLG